MQAVAGVATHLLPARSARATRVARGVWLRSPAWDLSFLILSAALVPVPLVMFEVAGMSQTAVNLVVAGLIGGPHLYSTFTYTFMEPRYRRRRRHRRHRRFLAASLALPVAVTLLAFANLRILAGSFQLGGTPLYVPDWATRGAVADVQIYGIAGLFAVFLALWLAKSVRDWRSGRLLVPSVLLIGLTIAVGFALPLFANSDVAFQGFNVWHSLQYLALVWFLMAMRKERGEIDNRFVAEMNGPNRAWRFYGLAVALTLSAAALVLVIAGVFGVPLQQAYYIVILSTLLQHYYLDHLQFTKLGDLLGTGDRLLADRA
jgi:hypothetical protein